MLSTLQQVINSINPPETRMNLQNVLTSVVNGLSSLTITTAGLVIKAGGGVLAKTGGAITYLFANGILRTIAAATDMPALVGTVVNATFNVYVFYIDSAGTLTSVMGTAGVALANVVFPQPALKKTMLGFIIINPTGTGNFVGGTTPLDDATVVPNAVFISVVGDVDPTMLLG